MVKQEGPVVRVPFTREADDDVRELRARRFGSRRELPGFRWSHDEQPRGRARFVVGVRSARVLFPAVRTRAQPLGPGLVLGVPWRGDAGLG